MSEKKEQKKDDFESEEILKAPGQGMELWKPVKEGETVIGKILAISQTRFNRVIRVSTGDGEVVSVPITTFLEDIDFDRLVGEKISIQFDGVAGRNCKLYTVKHIKDKF